MEEIMRRVYCHTSFDYSDLRMEKKSFVEGIWYDVYNDLNEFYISSYSNYFYTEQEYNRIKNLDELLNG